MEKPQFDGKAIEDLLELVQHHEHQQERSQQSCSDAAEGSQKGERFRRGAEDDMSSVPLPPIQQMLLRQWTVPGNRVCVEARGCFPFVTSNRSVRCIIFQSYS